MTRTLKSIRDIAVFLKERGEKLKPLSVSQIEKMEKQYGILFPNAYREFLSLMGNGAGSYMQGSSVFYNEIFLLREGVNELIKENNITPLPDDAVIFWMHQGYQAAYFRSREGIDPPVYYFSEGDADKSFRMKEKCLTDFFLAQLVISYPNAPFPG
jgi:hypothetical protein